MNTVHWEFLYVNPNQQDRRHLSEMSILGPEALVQGTWDTSTAARYLGCTEGTLRQWTSRRRVPFVKIGRLTRFRQRDLDEWIDEHTVRPA